MNWSTILKAEREKDYFKMLTTAVRLERAAYEIYPQSEDVFNAFKLTPFENVKVVILGQDPYHGKGQAHGLSFSVKSGNRIPPSLRNIYKELESDIEDFVIPTHGDLTSWANQGVLLLNTTLTVRESLPNSHQGLGWDTFTNRIISVLNKEREDIVFMLWGAHARSKKSLIDDKVHHIFECAHPSPFSADRGFFGCRHFSQANYILKNLDNKSEEINWQI